MPPAFHILQQHTQRAYGLFGFFKRAPTTRMAVFDGMNHLSLNVGIGKNRGYEDNMIFKFD